MRPRVAPPVDRGAPRRRYAEEVAGPRDVPTAAEIREALARVVALRREVLGAAAEDVERFFDPSYLLEADPSLGLTG